MSGRGGEEERTFVCSLVLRHRVSQTIEIEGMIKEKEVGREESNNQPIP
jgi:hypothetical protein